MYEKKCKWSHLISDLIIPACLLIPMIMTGFSENYSGLLNRNRLFFYCCAGIAFCWCVLVTYRFSWHSLRKYQRLLWMLYILLFLLTLLVPYHVPEDLFSQLHLIFAYGSFLAFNLLIFREILYIPKYLTVYAAGLFTSFLLCITAGEISGPAEAVTAVIISVLLGRIERMP